MADLKISQLSDGGASQAADEYVVARSGANYRIDGASVAAAATSVGTLTSLTVSGPATFAGAEAVLAPSPNTNSAQLRLANGGGNYYVAVDSSTGGNFGAGAYGFALYLPGGMLLKADKTSLAATFGGAVTMPGDLTVDTSTLKVDSANNRVGIGTASPSDPLHVEGASMLLKNGTSNVDLKLGITGYGMSLTYGTGALRLRTNATDRLTIDNDGNLGLGVTPDTVTVTHLQLPSSAVVAAKGDVGINFASNAYFNSGWKYATSTFSSATNYLQESGRHVWYSAGAPASRTAGNAITFTQAMTLDASGNLGIATSAPTAPLSVVNSAATPQTKIDTYETAQFRGGSIAYIRTSGGSVDALFGAEAGGSTVFAGSYTNHPFILRTNDTERARITSGGYFKASNDGTYNGATGTYHELSTDSSGNFIVRTRNTASSSPFGIRIDYTAAAPNGTGNQFLFCADNAATRAEIRSNGGIANYQANNVDLSDARTKTDITPLDSMWDKVAALEIVSYKYIDQTHDDMNLGVIAQQVETVEPVWVDNDGFGETPEGEEPMKTVYNKDIYFASIKALQEAMARIEALEARLEALEA